MHRFWESIIKPVLGAVKPGHIVEIGCAAGNNTRALLQFARENGAVIHAIDPAPKLDVDTWLKEFGDHFRFYRALSLNALPLIERLDAVLIDGDHNWYTVFHELKLVERLCEESDHPFPIVLLHDVGWPYARRDMYYNPENIPVGYLKPHKKKGMRPGTPELLDTGGLNSDLNNAIYENNLQNGVLTAVEDFVRESSQALRLITFPMFSGLGLLIPQGLLDTNEALRAVLAKLELSAFAIDQLTLLEQQRIMQAIALSEKTDALERKQADLAQAQEALAAKEAQVAALRREIHDLTATLQEVEAQLAATKEAQQHDQLAQQTAELARLRQQTGELSGALQQARGELSEVNRRLAYVVEQHNVEVQQLSAWIEELDKVITALLESKRWKMGNAIGEFIRKLWLQPPVTLSTEHRAKIMARYRAWKAKPVVMLTAGTEGSVSSPPSMSQAVSVTGPALPAHPKVSVVSAVLNKTESLIEFIAAFSNQTYPGEIELVLVDDGSTDGTVELIQHLQQVFESPGKLMIKLLCNERNLGNTGSRNVGLMHASGDILTVMDADCIVNDLFISERVTAHQRGFDVCIGPMGIESKGRDISALHRALLEDDQLLQEEMRLQYPEVPTSFVNCVTRNFSITRRFLQKLDGPLFDESFAYSKSPDSGFGWEDVEMGYRLYLAGASIWFARKAISVHKTHDPEVPDWEKAPRSAKNFARLLSKHPDLILVLPQWVRGTFAKIEAWVRKYGIQDNPDIARVAAMLDEVIATAQEAN